jgi:hypothetical protein
MDDGKRQGLTMVLPGDHAEEPLWRAFKREQGWVLGYKTNARFSDAGVMTIGQTGGTPLYALPDETRFFATEAEALAAAERFTIPEKDRL